MYVCMYVCVYVCIYIYIYIYMHAQVPVEPDPHEGRRLDERREAAPVGPARRRLEGLEPWVAVLA